MRGIVKPTSRFYLVVAETNRLDFSYRGTAVLLATIALLVVGQLYIAVPLLPLVAGSLRVQEVAATWMATAFGIAYGVGCLLFGPLSDRVGRRAVLVGGLIALAVTTALVGVSPSLPTLAAARALQGFVAASFAPVALAYLSETVPVRFRPSAMATVTTGLLLAGIAGQVVGQAVGVTLGWRWLFAGASLLYAGAAVLCARRLAPDFPAGEAGPGLASLYRRLAGLLGTRQIQLAYAIGLALYLAFAVMYTLLGAMLQQRFGMPSSTVLAIRAAAAPAIGLSLLSGTLLRRWGPVLVTIAGLSVAACGLLLVAAAIHPAMAVIGSVILVAGLATVFPAQLVQISAAAGPLRGAALSLNALVSFGSASLGPLLGLALQPIGIATLLAILAVGPAALAVLSARTHRAPDQLAAVGEGEAA
jgi:MFS transporter, YNFM family, putative membrane transport protein